jgi:methyltransferase-like protein 6
MAAFADASLSVDDVLARNNAVASDFQARSVRVTAAKQWNAFYKNNANRFFKDRHWIAKEFLEDLPNLFDGDIVLLESGCGHGSLFYPLLALYPALRVHAFDFAPNAIKEVEAHPEFAPERVHAFVHDLTAVDASLRSRLDESCQFGQVGQPVDLASCIFVLSALPPEKHAVAVQNIVDCLKPGGVLFLRDYAIHDAVGLSVMPKHRLTEAQAQLRFHSRPSANYSDPALLSSEYPLYRRSDNTLSYFFQPDELDRLMQASGMETLKVDVVVREMTNRKEAWSTLHWLVICDDLCGTSRRTSFRARHLAKARVCHRLAAHELVAGVVRVGGRILHVAGRLLLLVASEHADGALGLPGQALLGVFEGVGDVRRDAGRTAIRSASV